ncbi:MAG TPA: prolyl oligopeptidase family serine peptidase [Thermoanaerobaculia bacterium]|nr:prolyl oligopeptidase family serine peptidase [Thermoanaerobaculia bacterium]
MNAGIRRAVGLTALLLAFQGAEAFGAEVPACFPDGAPPMPLAQPVTVRPLCFQGRLLSFDQAGVTRYACLNAPRQSRGEQTEGKWPLLIYLHGSLTTPDSLYLLGKDLYDLHDTYPLSDDPAVRGFFILSPEGRRATPWASDGPETGTGFHWDEWYRNPSENLDALAIDHFVEAALATGRIDPERVYVFGWSNGAYMSALYGNWRSDRIAAIAQYAGADPWSRTPCPVPLEVEREVPLVLMRNLCDLLVPCATSSEWIETLSERDWPFEYHNLGLKGGIVSPDSQCAESCSTARGLYEHVRWPKKGALQKMLSFLRQHTVPAEDVQPR